MKLKPLYEQLKSVAIKFAGIAEKQLIKLVPQNIKATLHNDTFSQEGIERMVSLGLDLFISFILFLFPLGGWIIGIGYFITKDALPIYDGQSVGKHFFGLRVVNQGTLDSIGNNYKKSIIRGAVLLIPFLNLYDIYIYLTTGQRKVDQWTQSTVINNRYFIPSDDSGNEM